MIEEGKVAPPFTLQNTNGEKVSLKDLRGKHVVLFFYPKDDTPGCTKEACGFRDFYKEIEALDVVVIGISPDEQESHQAFTKKYKLPYQLLSDPTKDTMSKYGAFGQKSMYGKITMGVIRSTVWIDPTGKVVKHWKKVAKAETHPEKVLEVLKKELG